MSENAPIIKSPETEKPETSDHGLDEDKRALQVLRRREQELQAAGMSEGRAATIATLELNIAECPPHTWKDNELKIFIYGDMESPKVDVHFATLGIVVEAGKVEKAKARAWCVLRARVTTSERSVAGLEDAAIRINTLLDILAALNGGDAAYGWYCYLTTDLSGRHSQVEWNAIENQQDAIEKIIISLKNLPEDVRRKVTSALHWIREPRKMMGESYRSDVLRLYAGYWNAFECLVEAVCILRPQPKLGKKEKQDKIDQFLADRGGKLDPESIVECYRNFVDPGFVTKASHALKQCFPERADGCIAECFKIKPKQDRLYDIRNAINHGDIDAGNQQELIRVKDKYRILWRIVFGMLGQIIPDLRHLESGWQCWQL